MSSIVKKEYSLMGEAQGKVLIYQYQVETDYSFYRLRPYPPYFVKGTTLRLVKNMTIEDLTAKDNNGWIACKTRNQAKRLIARNRRLLKGER